MVFVEQQQTQIWLLERTCQNLQHEIDLIKGRPLTQFGNKHEWPSIPRNVSQE
jgi:hypothetical protein